jgi:hypothetical protein
MADADRIVERLRTTQVTQAALMREYRCGHAALMAAVLSRITRGPWRRIARQKLAAGGHAGRFRKGHATWNKGRKGRSYPGCRATQFRPGVLRGQAARNYRPVGTILVCPGDPKWSRRKRQPMRLIKVRDEGKKSRQWIPYARHLWQQAHGPVPPGRFVVHANGDSMDDRLENLILLDRREHMLRLYSRPQVIARCRAAAAKATRGRHRMCRMKKQAGLVVKARKPRRTIWECVGCGGEFAEAVAPCPKCGGLAMERRQIA